MTTKDPIREAFEKWASGAGKFPDEIKICARTKCYISLASQIGWVSWKAALSLIPHAAEILSGEAEVVLKETKPCD